VKKLYTFKNGSVFLAHPVYTALYKFTCLLYLLHRKHSSVKVYIPPRYVALQTKTGA